MEIWRRPAAIARFEAMQCKATIIHASRPVCKTRELLHFHKGGKLNALGGDSPLNASDKGLQLPKWVLGQTALMKPNGGPCRDPPFPSLGVQGRDGEYFISRLIACSDRLNSCKVVICSKHPVSLKSDTG